MAVRLFSIFWFTFCFVSSCDKEFSIAKSNLGLEEARQNGFTLRLAETNLSNRIGTKFFTVTSSELEVHQLFFGESKGSSESAEEHELVSKENGEFVWKTTNRKLSVCGDDSFKAQFAPEFEKSRNKIVRDKFNQNGSNVDSDDKESSKVLVKMNIPSRLLKQGDTWEGAIVYQIDKNPKEKSVVFKVEKIELKNEAVSAVITYNYEYDFAADNGSSITLKSNISDWIDVNTGEMIFKEEIEQGAVQGIDLKGIETTKRVPNLPENDLPCKDPIKATPTPTPTPTPVSAVNSNVVSNTKTSSNANSFSNVSNSTQKTSENVYAEVKLIGYILRSSPNAEPPSDATSVRLGGDQRLLLISPTNCKTCHQKGWYHIKILGTGKEGWVHGDAIYFAN